MKRVAGIVLFGMLLAACGGASVSGGGWGDSRTGTGRATFAFDIQCDDSQSPEVTGSFVYQDKAAGSPWGTVNIKGTVVLNTDDCDDAPSYTFGGIYTAQNKACRTSGGCIGGYVVQATDGGTQGASKGDQLSIELFDGIYNGYSNSGTVKGGNIKVENS